MKITLRFEMFSAMMDTKNDDLDAIPPFCMIFQRATFRSDPENWHCRDSAGLAANPINTELSGHINLLEKFQNLENGSEMDRYRTSRAETQAISISGPCWSQWEPSRPPNPLQKIQNPTQLWNIRNPGKSADCGLICHVNSTYSSERCLPPSSLWTSDHF